MRGLFLRWEVEKFPERRREMVVADFAATQCELDITIDEFRHAFGFGPHPDAERGALKIFDVIPDKEGDDKGTEEALEAARQKIRDNEAGLGEKGWKQKYPALFAAIFALIMVCSPVCAMEQIHNVTVGSTTYHVVELLHDKREKISKWNCLRFKRGEHYRQYRLLDNDHPLKLYDQQFKLVKDQLQGVPDNRSFNERHPYYEPAVNTINASVNLWSAIAH